MKNIFNSFKNVLTNKTNILLFLFASIIFMGIGYANINTVDLNVIGGAEANIYNEVLIIDAYAKDKENTTIYSYGQTIINSNVHLDNKESVQDIEIIIKNNSNNIQYYYDTLTKIGDDTYSNSNISFEIIGLAKGDKLNINEEKNVTIRFKYVDKENVENNSLKSVIRFRFGNIASFNLNGGDSQIIEPILLDSAFSNVVLTNSTPTKLGYIFKGWYDKPNYKEGNQYFNNEQVINDLNELEIPEGNNLILYAGWEPISYTVNMIGKGSNNYLPKEYTELTYIEGTGSQYIDTLINMENTDDYILSVNMYANTMNQWCFGTNGYLQFPDKTYKNKEMNIVISYNGATKDEIVTSNGEKVYSRNWSGGYFGSNNKVGIFKMGNSGNSWYSGSICSGKIYSASVIKNNVLVRNFVPCSYFENNIEIVGLYDTVEKKFFKNVGSGNFVKGDIVLKTKTIEVKYDQDINLTNDEMQMIGYEIIKWNTKEDGSGTDYPYIDSIRNLTNVNNDVITIYPIYEPRYIIYFNNQGETIEYTFNESLIAPEVTNIPENTIFDGWYGEDNIKYFNADGTYTGAEINKNIKVSTKFVFENDKYIKLDYIIATGSQYLMTGIDTMQSKDYIFEFELLDYSLNSFCFGGNAYLQYPETTKIGTKLKVKMIWNHTNNKLSVFENDELAYEKSWGLFATSQIGLFRMGHSGGIQNSVGSGKLTYAKIVVNDELVRDYIPAKDKEGNIGLYDFMTCELYTSSSSDEFLE